MLAITGIAGMRGFDDGIDQRLVANVLGQFPRLGLGQIHQRSFNRHRTIQSQAQGLRHGINGSLTAVGITGIVGLAHARHQDLQAATVRQGGGRRQKDQVAPRNEGCGQAALVHFNGHLAGQAAFGNTAIAGQVHHMIRPQTVGKLWQHILHGFAHRQTRLHLDHMALAIVETDGLDAVELLQRPRKTGGTVLTARKQDQSGIGGR